MARIVILALVLALAGCSGGGLFGPARVVKPADINPNDDPRPLVQQVTGLSLERVPGGVLLRATGLPPTQGYFDADLLVLNRGFPVNGVLGFQFRAAPPAGNARPGTPKSREIIVGVTLSNKTLAGVRAIQVSGAANALEVRR